MKKKIIFKKAISELVFSLNSFLRINTLKEGFRVLHYHSITDELLNHEYLQMTTPKGIFQEQMKFLHKNKFSVISCREAVVGLRQKAGLPAKSVCITFDDGFKDNIKNALPVLERYGFKATIFLSVDFIGRGPKWLDWEEVLSMAEKSGIISFGSHTLSHQRLSGLSDFELEREIGASKNVLEDRLKRPVELIAYPFGSYGSFNARAIETAKRRGYKAAFTTIAGMNTLKTDPYLIKRTRICWLDDSHEFNKQLQGAYDWYRFCQRIAGTSRDNKVF